jgi:hypothetical protein
MCGLVTVVCVHAGHTSPAHIDVFYVDKSVPIEWVEVGDGDWHELDSCSK